MHLRSRRNAEVSTESRIFTGHGSTGTIIGPCIIAENTSAARI